MLFREPGFSKEAKHPQLTQILVTALLKNWPNWLLLPGKGSLFRDLEEYQKGQFSSRGPDPTADLTSVKA